jgi:hypothetical protein
MAQNGWRAWGQEEAVLLAELLEESRLLERDWGWL